MKLKAILVFLFLVVGLIYGDEKATKTSKAKESSEICKKCKCNPDEKVINCSKKGLTKMFTVDDWSALEEVGDEYEILRMDHNLLDEIDVPFPTLKSALKIIDFSHNKIKKIVKNAFTNLSYVEEIDLSYNDIPTEALKPNVFEGKYSADEYEPIKTLKILKLSFNLLHNFDDDIFEHVMHLQELHLDNNPLQVIHPSLMSAFSDIPQLTYLNLSRCELKELPDSIFHPFKALKVLDLQGNLFENVPTKALYYAKNVRELYLDDCPIGDLNEKNSFPVMPNLEKLSMTYMQKLRKISHGAFAGLEKLKELRLSNNHHLSSIEDTAFTFKKDDETETIWPPLRKLSLDNNNLTTLTSDVFIKWEEMEELHLHDNPWICDCELNYVLSHLMPIVNRTTPHLIEHIKCAEPPAYKDRQLMELKNEDYHLRCLDKYGRHPENDSALLVALLIGVLLGIPLTFACILIFKRLFGERKGAAKYSRAFYKRADMQDDMHI
ncbi:hypothetical protein PVAND_009416 [Polypedilum vanderplanki]|uniref:Uncharacterized protein n=1 Tax=Polypedilum vanderplanki TaxID=319348 RepID=A0A9J6CD31_POLVA|nr:hypothetical protein PVAND_009416 [Polypedilum vanderplanki]